MFSSQINPGLMINNKAAILRKLKEINLNYDWFETLETNPTTETLVDDEVDHDFNREMHFYRQAQASVIEGLKRLHSFRVPTKRPDDHFAEMVKSDQYMHKVKKALVERTSVLSKIEKDKKLRKEKNKVKKVKSQDFSNETHKKGKPVKQMTKKALNKKKVYGCAGGQKKRSKYNTAESAANVSHGKKGKPKIYKKKFNTNRF